MNTRTVAVLYGGRSGEHEVSLRSAASIIAGLRQLDGLKVMPVLITKDGSWLLEGKRVAILPDPQVGGLYLLEGENAGEIINVDVVFPVLHGTYGEDGTVQGLLDLARIPYVGAGVSGSAVGMDKIFMKAALLAEGLPVGDYRWFTAAQWAKDQENITADITEALGFPCFVKPANLGSSVGISKAYDRSALVDAVTEALSYDRRVLVEKFLPGREIECSVLGHDNPLASVPGEVIPGADFYDYHAKYIDDSSQLVIPAQMPAEMTEKIRDLAVKTFVVLDCSGLGRIDFFVDDSQGLVWINEINTLPGFTTISMYPKLWEASGTAFNELLSRLIELAVECHAQKENLKTTFDAI
ncbi:MAG: D-alanine--D-alanine ligase family protein [Bacillota bacterium]|nr:D-alanine--D-alanine ligase family protein [Bacillota bacterium]